MAHDPLARTLELVLLQQAAQWPVALDGRQRSAADLDEFVCEALRLIQPETFAEVGAFEASASQRVLSLMPECRVVAFEASPHSYAHHREALETVGVDYQHAAITDRDGVTELRLEQVNGTKVAGNAASLMVRSDMSDHQMVTVPALTLDSALGPASGSTALWIDVEGAVGRVIAGGHETLSRTVLAKVEVEDATIWHGQTVAVDVISELLPFGLYPVCRDVEYPGQYNIVFAHDSVLRDAHFQRLLDGFLKALAGKSEPSALRQNESLRRMARPIRRIARMGSVKT